MDLSTWIKDKPVKALTSITLLFTVLAGTFTTGKELVQSIYTGSDFGRSGEALQQRRLWETNFECVKGGKYVYITNQHNAEIGSLVCPSGDVLISGKKVNQNSTKYTWVSWSDSSGIDISKYFSIIPTAYASMDIKNEQYVNVMCSRIERSGLLKQRVSSNQGCYDQWINMYTGRVVSWGAPPCNCYNF